MASTGSCEGAHKRWDQSIMHSKMNRDVTTVISKICGVNGDGSSTTSLFSELEKRESDANRIQEDVSSKLAQAKACFMFLLLRDESVHIHSEVSARVRSFGRQDSNLKRHADPTLLSTHSSFPKDLQLMADELAYGGGPKFEDSEGEVWYPLMRETGRCSCEYSLYHGVCSAKGFCKHKRLEQYVAKYTSAADDNQRRAVYESAADSLIRFVNNRERSKPSSVRCMPLY